MFADPWLGTVIMSSYLGLLTVVWLAMIIGVKRWGKQWLVEPSQSMTAPYPLSICVPARNEEDNIETCLRAALASDYPEFEVIVVDDRSEDQTGAIARKLSMSDPRIRVIDGTEPPAGWAGKPWACYRAAKESQGAWLLFIDADVQVDPRAARTAVQLARSRELAMLSFFGSWRLVTFWERALIPAIGWLIRGSINLSKHNDRSESVAFANGQFILVSRSGYAAVEGHSSVRDQVLEDVRLAEVVKRTGLGAEIRPAPWAFDVRLYRSLTEIVRGYTKNIYEGLGRKPVAGFGAASFLFICALLPYLVVLVDVLGRGLAGWHLWNVYWTVWMLLICVLQVFFRYQQECHDGRSGTIAWTHPIANVILIFILLRSTLKVRVDWKGRSFIDGRAD